METKPSNQDNQRDAYSGHSGTAKKRYTIKYMLISTSNKWIKYPSNAYHGRSHDLSLLHTEFDAE